MTFDLRRPMTVEQLAQDIRDRIAEGDESSIDILVSHEVMLDIAERLLAVEQLVQGQ